MWQHSSKDHGDVATSISVANFQGADESCCVHSGEGCLWFESDQCQISSSASPQILCHTVRRTWLYIAYSDEKWLYCKLLLSHSYIFPFKGWENVLFELRSERVTLSLPGVINFKFPLQPHQKYYVTQYEELGCSYLTEMRDDYTTNCHYCTHTFLFRKVGKM